jgi:hypothetical protein
MNLITCFLLTVAFTIVAILTGRKIPKSGDTHVWLAPVYYISTILAASFLVFLLQGMSMSNVTI